MSIGASSERIYNDVSVRGEEWLDKVCLNEKNCVEAFEFFVINNARENIHQAVDGFLGLGRSEPFKSGKLANVDFKRGPSYVDALYNEGLISENTFSLFLSANTANRYIHFGEPMTTSMNYPDKLMYIKLEDDLFWSTRCQGFAFGPLLNDYKVPNLETEYIKNGHIYSIFDSSSATIQIPDAIFDDFLDALNIEAGKTYKQTYEENVGMYVPCGLAYPDLHFLFDRTWLQVLPSDYVKDVSDTQDGSQCLMLITRGQDLPFLVMGLPLFVGYYTVHDDTKSRLGFVPHLGSAKKGPYFAASNPSVDLRDAVERTDYDDLESHPSKKGAEKSEKEEEEEEYTDTEVFLFWLSVTLAFCCCFFLFN